MNKRQGKLNTDHLHWIKNSHGYYPMAYFFISPSYFESSSINSLSPSVYWLLRLLSPFGITDDCFRDVSIPTDEILRFVNIHLIDLDHSTDAPLSVWIG